MINPGYVQAMARYNAWQNNQLIDTLDVMDESAILQDRGAFFGSILKTLSHALWGDTIWMGRFYGPVTASDARTPSIFPTSMAT